MAYRLNEAIYNGDYEHLERLLRDEKIDPNELNGVESPLVTVFRTHSKPEVLELLLEYGADSNKEEGSGITIFTDIIFFILSNTTGRWRDFEVEDFKEYLRLLINYGADMNLSEPGNPTANMAVNDWARDYSSAAAYQRAALLMGHPITLDPDDVRASNELKNIINEILDEIDDNYTAKQRSAFAKTGMPQNIINSVVSHMDDDVFNKTGNKMLDSRRSRMSRDSMQRYDPDETYEDYLYNKQFAEYANYLDTLNGGKKKTKKKRGGVGTPRRDRVPYEVRNTPEAAMEYIRAVIRGDYSRIEELLNMGLNINSKNYNGFTALAGAAVIKKDPNMVEFLLKNNADPNIKIDNHGNIPLINYIMNVIDLDTYTRKKIVELLIKYGGEANYDFARGRINESALTRPLDNDEERYLRERMYRDRQRRNRKLNTAKLLNPRLAESSEQPDEMALVERLMENYDKLEDKKRDEELRNELIGEYVNELNQYGGK